MKGTTMRKLLDLEDNLVPVKSAYREAFKGMGKTALIFGGIYCTYHFLRGFFEEASRQQVANTTEG